MLKSYKYYLITESSKREKTIKKYKDKILKFLNFPDIADEMIDMCISEDSTKGIKYSIWFANQFKDSLKKEILKKNEYKDKTIDEILIWRSFNPSDFSNMIIKAKHRIKLASNTILDWLKSPIREEQVNLSTLTLKSAFQKAAEWHESLEASGIIEDETGENVLEFDDGFYWIDLGKSECRDEADAMGHCATTGKGTLFSLRKNKSPHVTMSFNKADGTIYQMKGKNNKKPISKYHPYIVDFLIKMEVKEFGKEYNPDDDFSIIDINDELFDKLNKAKPDLVAHIIYDKPKIAYKLYKENKLKDIDISKYFSWEFLVDAIYSYEATDKKFITYLSDEFNKINFDFKNGIDSLGYHSTHINNFSNILLWYFNFIPDKAITDLLLYKYFRMDNGVVAFIFDIEPLEHYKEENGIWYMDLRKFLYRFINQFLFKGISNFYDEWDYYFDVYENDDTKKDMEEYFCKNYD